MDVKTENPTTIEIKENTLTVSGEKIYIDKVIEEIEEKLKKNLSEVKAVHFVGGILYVSRDIIKDCWRGISIGIYVNEAILKEKIIWVFSGKESHGFPSAAAVGQDGSNGNAGDSGEMLPSFVKT